MAEAKLQVTRRLRSTTTRGGKSYLEKEESDLTPDIVDSSSDDENGTNSSDDIAPIWLQDDVASDVDVALDSDTGDIDVNTDQDTQLQKLLDGKDTSNGKDGPVKTEQEEEEEEEEDDGDAAAVTEKLRVLDEFVKQSQVYSGIIADTLLQRSKEISNANIQNSIEPEEEIASKEPPKKRQRRTRTRKSITDYFSRQEASDTLNGEEKPKKQEDQGTLDGNSPPGVDSTGQPSLLENCTLKPYQMEGLNWLITLYENGLNGILADEMGLGKTVQSIALLAFIYEMDTKGPFLIAVPLSTIDNWMNEFTKFAPSIPVLKYYHNGGPRERSKLLRNFFRKTNGTGVVITSYDIILRDTSYIMSKDWKFLIVDEGHRLKNINCKLIRELKRIRTSNRLLLTGTPLQNNLAELWSLLNFIMPEIFSDFEMFSKWFDFKDLDLGTNSKRLNKVINDELEKNLVSNLHTILKPFLLRRLKRNVLNDILPPKREYIINCPLTPIQRKFYTNTLNRRLKVTLFKEYVKQFFTVNAKHIGKVSNRSIRDFIDYKLHPAQYGELNGELKDNEVLKSMERVYNEHIQKEILNKRLQNPLMQLRLIVDSTFLFYFPYLEPDEMTLDELLKTSGKLQILQQLIPSLVKKQHKVLIFSQFVHMLELLEDWCDLNGLKSLRIDGSVDNETRRQDIAQFNKEDDDHPIYLLSTKAAGLGINLTSADTVVLFDSDWNPQVDLQAMDRCHRIGQDKPVIIYRLCCDNTVEHVVLTRASSKRNLEKLVIQMGRFNTLKRLALDEQSLLKQNLGTSSRVKSVNKELLRELSELLSSNQSSIGFSNGDNNELTRAELRELTDRSMNAYQKDRVVQLPHVRLFETVSNM